MYKVRFHLAKGKFYKCWQVTSPNGDKDYYDPETHNLFMWGCRLRNQRKTAEKIHSGEHKTVCAWVECETFGATTKYQGNVPDDAVKVSYNPRKKPYWVDSQGVDVDDMKYNFIYSVNTDLFTDH